MCNCADMPDMPASQPDMHCAARHASPTRAGKLWRKTFIFTFIFPGDKTRQDKILVPWTMDGSLVFVATAYRLVRRGLGGKRGRGCAC